MTKWSEFFTPFHTLSSIDLIIAIKIWLFYWFRTSKPPGFSARHGDGEARCVLEKASEYNDERAHKVLDSVLPGFAGKEV
jgi:hypothetical protein